MTEITHAEAHEDYVPGCAECDAEALDGALSYLQQCFTRVEFWELRQYEHQRVYGAYYYVPVVDGALARVALFTVTWERGTEHTQGRFVGPDEDALEAVAVAVQALALAALEVTQATNGPEGPARQILGYAQGWDWHGAASSIDPDGSPERPR
jgi:hypothetical protein